MQEPNRGPGAIGRAWKLAWTDRRFRKLTVIGSTVLLAILITIPFFFSYIEQRQGIVLNDRLLQLIPAHDVSVPTFIIIWSMTLLLWFRCVQDPSIFIVFLVSFIILLITRVISMTLVPLDPPPGLIPLQDPLSSIFYGGTDVFVTKDLFYSGHTSIQLLMFLTFKRRTDKVLALLSTVSIAVLVLVQHVHYSIDVLAALVFSYFIFLAGKKITRY